MNKNKTIIFDLDGTLIDSVLDIALCMNQVLKELKLPTYEIYEYNYFLGGGIDVLVNNVLKEENKESEELVTKRFKEVYDMQVHTHTKPYEGIYDLLKELEKREYNLAVLSNKPHKFTKAYVKRLFKDINFKEIHGQKDEIPKKPDPIAAINIAKELNTPCHETYFVGDTKVDMQTALNAKMISIGVLWGFRDEKELKEYKANYIVSSPLEILNIIK